MKFGAIYCIYDDHEYLDISILPIKDCLDKVLFLISDVPWNGEKSNNSETIKYVENLCSKHPNNFELIQGHWENEIDQRNFGLFQFFKEKIDYAFIIDSDEIYHDFQFKNMITYIKQNPAIDAFHIEWDTFWKKDYCIIRPREDFRPIVAVKVKNFQFTIIRGGITSIMRTTSAVFKTQSQTYNGVIIPGDIVVGCHLSYARSDEYIKRKLETNSHHDEFIGGWYENIWKKWNLNMRNLHPINPQQYNIALKADLVSIPQQLKTFIKKERLPDRKCSIVILNWNSCSLLKKCLNAISRNTKRKNIEVIIVDNGSTKDNSVEFIKKLDMKFPIKTIFNKENHGFIVGSNQGMLNADPKSDICLLNVDAIVQEGWLNELYNTLINIPEAGIVGPLGNEVASGHQKEGYVERDTIVPNLYGYCMLIMNEVIEKIGYLDERYKIGGYEDNDYCVRTKLAGYETIISAKSLVKHKAHQVYTLNKIDDNKRQKIDEANEKKYLNKFFGVLLQYSKVYNLFENNGLAKAEGLVIK